MTSDAVVWPRSAGPLTLRPPTSADLDQLLAWRNRPEVTRWLLRTTVDPDAFRRVWLESVEDPRQHDVVALLDGARCAAGDAHELVERRREDGLRMSGGGPHHRVVGELHVDDRAHG